MPAIVSTIDQLDPGRGRVCDLFAGSGTVSLALSKARPVVAADIQEYSRVLCSALLVPPQIPPGMQHGVAARVRELTSSHDLRQALDPLISYEMECLDRAEGGQMEPLCELIEESPVLLFQSRAAGRAPSALHRAFHESVARLDRGCMLDTPISTFARQFGGVYFSYLQAVQLDLLLNSIHEVPEPLRDIFLAAALSAGSEIVNTVGKQFAQPIRPRRKDGSTKHHLIEQILRDRRRDCLDTYEAWLDRFAHHPRPSHASAAVRGDYRTVLKSLRDVALVYADPPYTRDHYSRYYHVLETMCFREVPEVSTVRVANRLIPSRGVYRQGRHQSPFCIKSQVNGAFEELFRGVQELGVPLVLSYSPQAKVEGSRPRLLTLPEICSMAAAHFRDVRLLSPGPMAHNKLNHAAMNAGLAHEAEVLITCLP
jgi:adenine-specific DNA-methyltransferase